MRPVAADTAVAEPAVFVAVTAMRMVASTSAAVSRYSASVAPSMSVQLEPLPSHRRHW
jgi:hypothetical protein